MPSPLKQLLLLVLLPLLATAQESATPAASPETLGVMTYNLRYASMQKPNSWPERRPVTAALIREFKPHLIGTQEGVYAQISDMAEDLPEYEWIGLGREGGSRGEFMAVFYLKERFKPLAFDHYWLSDTPMLMNSKGWGNNIVRMVTWVRFRDLKTGKEFYFINTHFDHQSQPAREKSAELLRKRVEELKTDLPIILVGDFNAVAGKNKAYETLTADGFFKDTWETAEKKRGQTDISTFHNYRGPNRNGSRIDWILTRGPIKASETEIITFQQNGQYPSDHFPVMTWLTLEPK